MARYWRRARRFLAQKILHTDDTPHAIAMGTAIAMFIAFLPLIGLQTILALGAAALLRANKAVCIPIVWITNVFTMVPIYGACLAVGRFVMAPAHQTADASLLATLEEGTKVGLLDPAFWKQWLSKLPGLGLELWVGCAIVGLVAAILSYALARWGVTHYRERRRRRLLRRSLLRANATRAKVVRHSEPV